MIRINQLKLAIFDIPRTPEGKPDAKLEAELLKKKAAKLLGVRQDGIRKLKVLRRSVDAREKDNILFVYTLVVRLHDSITGPTAATEEAFIKKCRNKNILREDSIPFVPPMGQPETATQQNQPVIIGAGPCGLFAALILAKAGQKPIIIERGAPCEERELVLERFFETGKLDTESNVQFGEGGAGMFSDGKLNTSVKGQSNYIRFVLETFVRFGAAPQILTDQKPHVGTDVLTEVVKRMRKEIETLGGTFCFHTKLESLELDENGKLCGVVLKQNESLRKAGSQSGANRIEALFANGAGSGIDKTAILKTTACILAIGHSARDTFSMLQEKNVQMEPKSFAMGIRIQHPQRLIDEAMYGKNRLDEKVNLLGHASYKLTHRCQNGRSIYSFCMCPGGYVVNSSSETGRLCINGMSYHDRQSGMANAALIVNVTPADFPSDGALGGILLQRELEEKAYALLDGLIPYETYAEFAQNEKKPNGVPKSDSFEPRFKGYAAAADVRGMLPLFMQEAVLEGMTAFARQIPGYDASDACIAGIEARTSSPVRIVRAETGESSIPGLYPAGEGAGYAGGITSAAVDGIRTALQLLGKKA